MRRLSAVLSFAMAACLTSFTASFAGAAEDIVDKGVQSDLAGRRYALLVGVNDYSYFSPLTFCDNDIANLSKTLGHNGFDSRDIVVLRDGLKDRHLLPNKSNIVTQLKLLLESVEKNDLVVVAFSGHGVHIQGKSYLCPYDAQLDRATDTMIALDDVYDLLQKSPAQQKVLIVDACRNDPTPSGTRAPSGIGETNDFTKALNDAAPPQGTVIFNSCAPNQFSVEDPDFQSGVFMHYVIAGLGGEADKSKDGNKDGKVSLFELYMYSQYETKTFVRNKRRLSQTPVLKGELTGVYELAVVSDSPLDLSMPKPGDVGLPATKTVDSTAKPAETSVAAKTVDPDATRNILGSNPALKQANQFVIDGKYQEAIDAFTNVIKLEENKDVLKLALKLRSSAYLSSNASENIARALADSQASGSKYLPVTVRRDKARLMVGTETVATLKVGQALEVSEVQGEFVAVISVDGNDTITGWIEKVNLSDPPKPAPQPVVQAQPQYNNNNNYNNGNRNSYGYDLSDLNAAERAEARNLERQYDKARTEGQMRAIERKANQLEKKVNSRLDRGF